MAFNSSILTNRAKVIKTFDNVKGAIDAWSFKNLFFALLFARIKHPEKYKDYLDFKFPQLEKDWKGIVDAVERLLYEAWPSTPSLSSLADIPGTFKGLNEQETSERLLFITQQIWELDLSKEQDFGELYEYVVDQCGQRAGKSAGEFYTPNCLTELIFQVVEKMLPKPRKKITRVYDPTGGTGSLLLKMNRLEGTEVSLNMQELNHKSFQFAQLNMLAHGINDFCVELGDTLTNDKFKDQTFDVVVANYPYGIRWDPESADPKKFQHGLAPTGKADFAFIQHMLNKLDYFGVCVTLCFPGILFREGEEGKIRRSLIKAGLIRAVIDLPPNLFYGTSISPSLLVLTRSRFHNYKEEEIIFIDATKAFKKQPKQNTMRQKDIEYLADLAVHKSLPWIYKRPPEGSAIEYSVKKIDEVLDANRGDGCLCPRRYINVQSFPKQVAYLPEEESERRTRETLLFLKGCWKLEKVALDTFQDSSLSTKEFLRVLEDHLKPLWEQIESEN